MKPIFFIAAFLFLVTIVRSQPGPNDIDSLQKEFARTNADTTRVELLRATGYTHRNLATLLESLALAKKLKYHTGEADCYNTMGNYFFGNSNYLQAMQLYLQGLKVSEDYDYAAGISKTTGNIGAVYLKQGDYRRALDKLLGSLAINKQLNKVRGIAIQSYDIAKTYLMLGVKDSALLFGNQSYQYAVMSNDSNALTNSLHTLGEIHQQLGNPKLALEYFRMAIPYAPGYMFSLSETYVNMATLFQQMNLPDSCIIYAQKALASAREYNNGEIIFRSASLLSALYEKKDVNQSFSFYKIAMAGKDSMFNAEKVKQIENMTVNETLRQQERESDKLKANEERKRNLQYAAIAIALITFVILFLVLSRSIIVKTKFIEFFAVLGLLAVFEFINLLIHPYLAHATNDSPVFMLIVLIAIGALLIPLHHKLQKWITGIMVEKNKKIRLAAAKKTIANLEGEQTK